MYHYDIGTNCTVPYVKFTLVKGESIYCRPKRMISKSSTVRPVTDTHGGLFAAAKRKIAGDPFFMPTYTCHGERGTLIIGAAFSGSLTAIPLLENQRVVCQKGTFLCAEYDVSIGPHFQAIPAALLSGEGLIMEEITGPGHVFLTTVGGVLGVKLEDGEVHHTNPGNIAFHEPSVKIDFEINRNLPSAFFGGEGFYWVTLTGPGKVWIQPTTLKEYAENLAPYILPK